jgi:3-oxoacyl-[acyl-carrier protein] reductase
VIVNISSVSAKGNAGQTAYSAAKAGLESMTKVWSKELGSFGIRCVAIAPGFIETEMTAELNDDIKSKWIEGIPMKRIGTPEDVANAVVFLASDMSAYVNGQVLNVCGGMST